jgi:hypothetical protein
LLFRLTEKHLNAINGNNETNQAITIQ